MEARLRVTIAETIAEAGSQAVTGTRGAGWARRVAVAGTWALASTVTPLVLYFGAALLLLAAVGRHPQAAHNWEGHMVWRFFPLWDQPSARIFELTEGLMTDSGLSPLVALPVWLGFKLGGVGVASMRVPVALITALSVPLLWLVGRRIGGPRATLLAAVLLALSPVFLLYGGTATNVGISLVPALLTIYALLRVLQRPQSWLWLLALQALLAVGAYAYAPVRFLWPISLLLLAGEMLWRKGERRRFLVALAVTAAGLPAMLAIAEGYRQLPVTDAVLKYYKGRGEQIAGLNAQPENYGQYLRLTPEEKLSGKPTGTPEELALRLINQNAQDYVKLLLDWDTRPALTDHWNPGGRLYPIILVPFFLVGLAAVLLQVRRRVEYRALLALFFGLGLPLLLTSKVHIGRLIFVLPLLLLIAATGFLLTISRLRSALARMAGERGVSLSARGRALAAVVPAVALLGAVASTTWLDYSMELPPSGEERVASYLTRIAPTVKQHGSAALVAGDAAQAEVESIAVAAYRLHTDSLYRFVDVSASHKGLPPPPEDDPRPVLYYGGLLEHMAGKKPLPNLCDNLYLVAPHIEREFKQTFARRQDACLLDSCGQPFQYRLLPE